jgi:FAD/FMN-containing dehydrogenase
LETLTALDLGNCELLSLFAHAPSAPQEARGMGAKVCAVRANIFGRDAGEAARTVRRVGDAAHMSGAMFKLEDQRSTFEQSFVESMDFRRGFGLGRFGVDNIWTNDPRAALAALATAYAESPSWKSHVVISMRPPDLAASDAACRMHGSTYLGLYASWDEVEADAENLAWLRRCAGAIAPMATGHYINEIDAERDPGLVERSFDVSGWRRLAGVRERYDPDARFVGFFGL